MDDKIVVNNVQRRENIWIIHRQAVLGRHCNEVAARM